jgi:ribosomal protein S18 acetylase RimI-like enzyme
MTSNRTYPEERAGTFPRPPRTIADREGREIELHSADRDDQPALLEMYEAFDPADRAQGIPPVKQYAVENWLETVLEEGNLNAVASYDGDVIGHAMLVADGQGEFELAIFVLGAYQSAGIGTDLIETLLGHGQDEGIEKVWLTVERWNKAAIGLYQKVGFEICDTESFEIEMSIRLD